MYAFEINGLFHLDAAEGAGAFDVESLDGVVGLEVALALDAGKGCLDGRLDTDVAADADFHTAKAAFNIDDGTVEDVGIAQVEGGETKAGVYIGTFETLSGELKQLFAETDVDLAYLAAVLVNLLQFVNSLAVGTLGVAAALACENKRETPYYRHDADDVFPKVVP